MVVPLVGLYNVNHIYVSNSITTFVGAYHAYTIPIIGGTEKNRAITATTFSDDRNVKKYENHG